MKTHVWSPVPEVRFRLTEVGSASYAVEIWQKLEGDAWSYLCLKPPELKDMTLDWILQETST